MIPVPRISELGSWKLHNFFVPGFEISWAGQGPSEGLFCLGSDDGRVCLVEADLTRLRGGPYPVAESGEVINGIAFSGGVTMVTTRGEIIMCRVPGPGVAEVSPQVVWDGGAHDVRATASGGFIAPLGKDGLLSFEGSGDGRWSPKTIQKPGDPLYFYRAESIPNANKSLNYVCANRFGGLTACVDSSGSGYMKIWDFKDSDIVDLCTTAAPASRHSAIALGIDNSLHFVPDVLNYQKPQTLRLGQLRGRAYRLLVARGHLILLTSKAVYVLSNLASRFFAGQPVGIPEGVVEIPLEAVDAEIAFDRWLLVVMPDGLLSFDVESLVPAKSVSLDIDEYGNYEQVSEVTLNETFFNPVISPPVLAPL